MGKRQKGEREWGKRGKRGKKGNRGVGKWGENQRKGKRGKKKEMESWCGEGNQGECVLVFVGVVVVVVVVVVVPLGEKIKFFEEIVCWIFGE